MGDPHSGPQLCPTLHTVLQRGDVNRGQTGGGGGMGGGGSVKLLTHKQTLSHKCLGLSSYLSDSINRRC